MRNITEQEIKDAPEWATHYFYCPVDTDLICYESETYFTYPDSVMDGRAPNKGLYKHSKEIPREPIRKTTNWATKGSDNVLNMNKEKTFPANGELGDKITRLIRSQDGMSLAEAVGILEIVKIELIRNN